MKELKIGETITMKCVEGCSCDKCAFIPDYECDLLNPKFKCRHYDRTDHKNVHFEIVENPQKEWLDKAVKYIDENVGTMTAVAFRKYMEEQL